MRQVMGVETLKTGEVLTIESVLAPDSDREAQIKPFLGHKGPNYQAHINGAFADQCDQLETRFYIGVLNDEVVANVMICEYLGVGLLGHVRTREDQRRKGIATAVMALQMQDFRERGGHVLMLGTGYQKPPYYIYQGFGFRDSVPGRPSPMRYDNPASPGFVDAFYAPSSYRIEVGGWRHWPLASLLAMEPSPAYLRSIAMRAWGITLLEGMYSTYMAEYGHREDLRPRVLESETGAVVAFATSVPDERWRNSVHLLDLTAHPSVPMAELVRLVEALPHPDAKKQCYTDPRDEQKIAALEQSGFKRTAVLPEQFLQDDEWQDAWVYTR
jgi:hypothetical protein